MQILFRNIYSCCFLDLHQILHVVSKTLNLKDSNCYLPPLYEIVREKKCIFKVAGVPVLILLVLQTSWKFILAFKGECFDAKSFKLISSLLLSALAIMISWVALLPCCNISWGLCCKPPGKYPQLSIHVHFWDCFFPALQDFWLSILDEVGDDHKRLPCATGRSLDTLGCYIIWVVMASKQCL